MQYKNESERLAHLSRRDALRAIGGFSVGTFAAPGVLNAALVDDAKKGNAVSVGAFSLLPAGSIEPQGWLRRLLEVQAQGLTGHLHDIWPDVGTDSGWLGGKGESWERGPYYLDGLLPLAWQLNDARLKAIAQKFVDWTLDHQQPDGMIGPTSNNDWWPRFVMLKVLAQYHELTADKRVLPVMDRYFRYQLQILPGRPLRDWGKFRWQDEALVVLWLYQRTDEPYLLDLVRLLQKQGFDWVANFDHFTYREKMTAEYLKINKGEGLADLALATHGVNNGQGLKAGPVWSLLSGQNNDKTSTRQALAVLDRDHGQPNGMFSCDEHLSGPDPSQGSELCTVVELMYSLELAMAITGDAALGDRLERIAFNALPGTLTDDMWAHQYNQQANQVEVSLHLKPWVTDGPESNLFGFAPNFGCCTANYHQGWPKFTNSLWMMTHEQDRSQSDELIAALYAPCALSTTIRDVAVHIVEDTNYPFRESIRFAIDPAAPIRFALKLRIPAWAAEVRLTVNDNVVDAKPMAGFARIERLWTKGDRVELVLPMPPRVSTWFKDSIAVERGPLVFSYCPGESWVRLRRNVQQSSDWQVFPAGPWNYALAIDPTAVAGSVRVTEHEVPAFAFSGKQPAITLSVRGRQLPAWRAEDGVANPLPVSPVKSDEPDEDLTLIPYAAAKLRITAFPRLG